MDLRNQQYRQLDHTSETSIASVVSIGPSLAEKIKFMKILNVLPRSYIQQILKDLLQQAPYAFEEHAQPTDLSPRELEVLVLVASGYTRSAISDCLGIRPNTAARHISNIYRKLDVSTVAEATTYAISLGFVGLGTPSRIKPISRQV